jgi:hypothetical protein
LLARELVHDSHGTRVNTSERSWIVGLNELEVFHTFAAQSLEDTVFVAVRDEINAARYDVKTALPTVDVDDGASL